MLLIKPFVIVKISRWFVSIMFVIITSQWNLIHTYLMSTNSTKWRLSWEAECCHLNISLPFRQIETLITTFTTAPIHWQILSWGSSHIHPFPMPSCNESVIFTFTLFFHLCLSLTGGLVYSGFAMEIVFTLFLSSLPLTLHVSPILPFLLSLRFKYTSQHPVLRLSQSGVLSLVQKTKFHFHIK